MNDPLALHTVPTPTSVRASQLTPSPQLTNLINRLSINQGDSMDTRLTLLMHLVYLTYLHLKEHTAK